MYKGRILISFRPGQTCVFTHKECDCRWVGTAQAYSGAHIHVHTGTHTDMQAHPGFSSIIVEVGRILQLREQVLNKYTPICFIL